MGSIERTPAGTWMARYRDPQGRSRRKDVLGESAESGGLPERCLLLAGVV